MAGKTKKNRKESKPTKPTKSETICDKHIFNIKESDTIRHNLLEWYDREQRTLPWRDIAKFETDENVRGYSVWVSEVMLQQTQVSTVIPYFNKWIEKWPTVKSLSEASLEDVLKTWSGLGYYSRGRRLHEGAKIIVEKLGGDIPREVQVLMKEIPGIGAYSAAAIASVAFQKAVGVVDGNVIRVLSRMRAVGSPASIPTDHLWKLANELVSKKRPGDFNQALMELGATVCTPQNPSCASCPVSSECLAHTMAKNTSNAGAMDSFLNKNSKKAKKEDKKNNIVDIEDAVDCSLCLPPSVWKDDPQVTAFPRKVAKKSPRKETVQVVVLEHSGKFLTTRRPDKGLLAGLIEFPNVASEDDEALLLLLKGLGVTSAQMKARKHVGEVLHLFSHIHTTYSIDHLVLKHSIEAKKNTEREFEWMSEEELETAAISTAMKKVFALVRKKPAKETGNKKRKRSSEDSKQKSIKSFFS